MNDRPERLRKIAARLEGDAMMALRKAEAGSIIATALRRDAAEWRSEARFLRELARELEGALVA